MNKLEQVFRNNVNGSSIISIDFVTPVKLTGGKKNPDAGRITKRVTGMNAMVFQNKNTNAYENMVNRRLAKEGSYPAFEVSPRVWGTRIPNTPLVQHNDKLYLEVIALNTGFVEYLRDGVVCDVNSIEGLPAHTEATQGGLNDKVIIRTISFDNIKKVRVDGEELVNN